MSYSWILKNKTVLGFGANQNNAVNQLAMQFSCQTLMCAVCKYITIDLYSMTNYFLYTDLSQNSMSCVHYMYLGFIRQINDILQQVQIAYDRILKENHSRI